MLGQATDDSCVPACVRMLLLDNFPEKAGDYLFSESFLRMDFETEREGSVITRIPEVLRQRGLTRPYLYQTDLAVDDLRGSLARGFAIAIVRTLLPREAHAVIVEELTDDEVAVRDPLPQGKGSAYRIPLTEFLHFWLSAETQCGSAVVVVT
ncbi:MAG: hypothetical protein ACREEM_39730 [Blastocatellia bacterium]